MRRCSTGRWRRAELAAYPRAEMALGDFGNGPPIGAPIALRIEGASLDTLHDIAARVERLLKTTPGTQYVTNPVRVARTDLRVAIDRAKAGLLGIPMLEIDRTVRLGLAGLEAGSLREGDGDARPVVVRLARTGRATPADLDRGYVSATNGRLAPLAQVAEVRFERAVAEIQRHNRTRSVTLTANVPTGHNTDHVTRQALGRLGGVAVPLGYRIVPAGEIESRQ